jgi:hypothetical protein
MSYEAPVQIACYDNDCYVPEMWARESLEILFEEMQVAGMVHRSFENEIAKYGDTVHTRRPSESKIMRRSATTTVANLVQATSSDDVSVVLNQWQNQTFLIENSAAALSFADLVETYLRPRIKTIARGVDRAVLGRMASCFGTTNATRAGKLAGLTSSTAYDAVVELDKILNQNKAPKDGRALMVCPSAKAVLLKAEKFVEAHRRGDGSSPIDTAQLGTILNFLTYEANNVNSMETGADIETGLDCDAAYAAEYAGALNIDGTFVMGEYMVVAGNDQPTYLTDTTDGAVKLSEALKYATENACAVTRYKSCAVTTTRAAGYAESISLKSHTSGKGPQVGQLISFCDATTGANRHTYTVIEATESTTTSEILLDRPLDTTITQDSTVVCPGPYGSINPAFHKNALALVTRPLAPQSGFGMMSSTVAVDGIGISIAMQDLINEGRKVAIDLLFGTAVLDSNLCVPLLG